jgi:hypothetical protein
MCPSVPKNQQSHESGQDCLLSRGVGGLAVPGSGRGSKNLPLATCTAERWHLVPALGSSSPGLGSYLPEHQVSRDHEHLASVGHPLVSVAVAATARLTSS